MFNFTLFSKALVDSNLTDAEFRLFCLILNNLSMSGSDEIEMKIPFIMDKLDKCERQARNLLSALNNKNYIIREVIGTTKNRHGNIISLVDDERQKIATSDDAVIVEKNCAMNEEKNVEKNCPPYNDYILINKSINKSILINREKSIEENIDYIDLGEASNESDTSTNEVNNEEINETISIDSNTSTEGSKPIETRTPSSNDESNTSINTTTNESNKTISADEAIKWLNSKLDEYYKTTRPNQSQSIEINVSNYFQSIDKQYFNTNQLRAISALEKRFNGIRSQKQNYFSKWKTNKSINSNNTLSPQVAPAPLSQNSTEGDCDVVTDLKATTEQKKTIIKQWYIEHLDDFTDYGQWQHKFEKLLDEEFGGDWMSGGPMYAASSSLHGKYCKLASEHFKELHTKEILEKLNSRVLETGPNGEEMKPNGNTSNDDGIIYDDSGEPVDFPF